MKQLQQQLQATKLELAIQKAKSHEAGLMIEPSII